jgi:hypothetical protein
MGMAMDSGEFLMHTYPRIGKVNEAKYVTDKRS